MNQSGQNVAFVVLAQTTRPALDVIGNRAACAMRLFVMLIRHSTAHPSVVPRDVRSKSTFVVVDEYYNLDSEVSRYMA